MHQKQKRIPSTGTQKAMVGKSIEQTRKKKKEIKSTKDRLSSQR